MMLLSALALHAVLSAGTPVAQARDTIPSPAPSFDREGPVVARFPAAVLAFLRSRGYAHPHGTMAVSTDSARQMLWPQVFESDVPDSIFRGIAPIVRTLVPAWPGGGPIMMAFRLDREDAFLGSGMDSTSAAVATPPEWRNRGQVLGYLDDVMSAHPNAYRRYLGRRDLMVRVLVDTDGTVALADVPRMTGDAEIDKYLPTIALRMRFRPATVAGRPVRSFMRLAVTMNFQ